MADNATNTAAPAASTPTPPPAVASPTAHNDAPISSTTASPIAAHGAPANHEAATGRLSRFQINDSHWQWKAGFRLFTVVCAVIGLSCFVWVGVDATNGSDYNNYWSGDDSWIGALSVPLIVSLIFNIIYLLVLFLSKRAVHPGVAVGVDLVLWLSIIVTGLFAMYGYFSMRYDYYDDSYSSSSYDDYYNERHCGSVNYIYDSYDGSCTEKTSDCPGWDNCEEKEAYEMMQHRAKTMLAGVAFNWLCLILHFILFVWACVDTSRRNRMKATESAKVVAERIVQEMVATGQLTRPAPTMLNDMRGQRQQPVEYYTPPAQRLEV